MPTPVSSLSIAIQEFAEFLDSKFGEDVVVTVDTAQKAQDKAKDSAADILNVFVYRLAPSGFHASAGHQDQLFLRASVLLTAFPRGAAEPEPDLDLRVLGHALAVLQSFPVIPVELPGVAPAGPGEDFRKLEHLNYKLDAVLQAPTMEEMNHIWTTQGGDLAYRLSAAYELSLIPIEPLSHRVEAPPTRAAILGVAASSQPTFGPDDLVRTEGGDIGIPLSGETKGTPPGADWLPLQLFSDAGVLTSLRDVADGTTNVDVALTGLKKKKVAITVDWTRDDGSADTQAIQNFTVDAIRPDDPAAIVSVALTNAANGDTATLTTVPARGNGTPVPDAPNGNVLTLTVGGG
ncbi:MAG: DUF4255 domain-containing protein [Rhodobacteraceae bacterium]|nr:DUF4255 domain-containing protein [Paracoccaceae bacterium]